MTIASLTLEYVAWFRSCAQRVLEALHKSRTSWGYSIFRPVLHSLFLMLHLCGFCKD